MTTLARAGKSGGVGNPAWQPLLPPARAGKGGGAIEGTKHY